MQTSVAAGLKRRINGLSYTPKWLLLGAAIGVIAGLGAVLFYACLQEATHLLLGVLAGYRPPGPAGEGGAFGSAGYSRAWAIPLVVTLGGLISGCLVFTFAPEAEGHGTDAAIDAVHHNPRGIRLRAVVVKIVASAITIGSGGSGGREGPTAQISAGFGSLLARFLDLSTEDGKIAVSVGIGSGIGAIFSAPLGGALLAADVVYRDDFEFEALLPGTLASIIAYAIFGAVNGFTPLFAMSSYAFHDGWQLVYFAVIGLLCGGIGLLYSGSFYGVVGLAKRLPLPRQLRPALGALAVGLLALWLPQVLGTGYGWIQKGLSGELLQTPLYIVLLLPFARILATSCSIGSGGSGGVFGPGMVIGAFTGLAVWRLLEPVFPGVGSDPAPYVVIGMMAMFGGISRAPIAVMVMVAEMTNNVSMLGPAMIAVALAWFIVKRNDDSIYRSQLRTRVDSERGSTVTGVPGLSTIIVRRVMMPPRVLVQQGSSTRRASERLARHGVPGAPVVDADGQYQGALTARIIGTLAPEQDALAGVIADRDRPTVNATDTLDQALSLLSDTGGRWLPVLDDARHVVGVLTPNDLVRGYQQLVGASLGRPQLGTANTVALEETIGPRSRLRGTAIKDSALPLGCVIATVSRGAERLPGRPHVILHEGDVLNLITRSETVAEVRRIVQGAARHVAADEQQVTADV